MGPTAELKIQAYSFTANYNKNSLQSNSNCPLAARCPGYTVNKFEQVQKRVGLVSGPRVNNFKHVSGVPCDLSLTNGIMGSGHMGSPL